MPFPFPTRHHFRRCGKGKCVLWAAHQLHDGTSPVSLKALRRDPTQAWILLRAPTVLSFMGVNNSLKNLLLQRRIHLDICLEPINLRPYKKHSANVLTLGPEPLYSCAHSDWQQSTTQLSKAEPPTRTLSFPSLSSVNSFLSLLFGLTSYPSPSPVGFLTMESTCLFSGIQEVPTHRLFPVGILISEIFRGIKLYAYNNKT